MFYTEISPIFRVWVIYWAFHFSLFFYFFLIYPEVIILGLELEEKSIFSFLTICPFLIAQIVLFSNLGLDTFKTFFNRLHKAITSHYYCPITFFTILLLITISHSRYKDKRFLLNKNKTLNLFALFSVYILFLFVFCKELFKKAFPILFVGALFQFYNDPSLIFFVIQICFFIFFVSSLALSEELVLFIESYFGPFFFGWMGCYQPIGLIKKKDIQFFCIQIYLKKLELFLNIFSPNEF